MGTYTTNYQLYMPTIGETGWGTLVNGNYQTIDTTMKGLSNRITTVENEVNGNLSCTSVTTSGTITGNGGIVGTIGTFSGAVTAKNIHHSGLIPYTVFLTTDLTNLGFSIDAPYAYSNVGNGATVTFYVVYKRNMPKNSNATVKGFHCVSSDIPGVIDNIKVKSGTWTYLLTSGISTISGTLTTSKGTKFNYTGGTGYVGTTITQPQALEILSGVNTVTINNTYSQYQDANVYISMRNTSGVEGYMRAYPSCLDT